MNFWAIDFMQLSRNFQARAHHPNTPEWANLPLNPAVCAPPPSLWKVELDNFSNCVDENALSTPARV